MEFIDCFDILHCWGSNSNDSKTGQLEFAEWQQLRSLQALNAAHSISELFLGQVDN